MLSDKYLLRYTPLEKLQTQNFDTDSTNVTEVKTDEETNENKTKTIYTPQHKCGGGGGGIIIQYQFTHAVLNQVLGCP